MLTCRDGRHIATFGFRLERDNNLPQLPSQPVRMKSFSEQALLH